MYKAIKKYKQGGIAVDPLGYYNPKNKGKKVIIPDNHITMKGLSEPIIGTDNLGNSKLMQPNEDYVFPGSHVLETPLMQMGGLSRFDLERKAALDEKLRQQKLVNLPSISQYTPKEGDQERMNVNRDVYRQEEAKPLNKAASSKLASNAMENIVEPMSDVAMAMEGAGLAGKGLKQVGKFLTEKTALKDAYKLNPYKNEAIFSQPEITRQPINYYDKPGFKEQNPKIINWENYKGDVLLGNNANINEDLKPYIKMATGGFQPLYKKTLDDFNQQTQENTQRLQGAPTYNNSFAQPKQNQFQSIDNLSNFKPQPLSTLNPSTQSNSYETSFDNFTKDNTLDIKNNQVDNKKSILGNYPSDPYTKVKDNMQKNEDYSYIPSLVNGVLGSIGNSMERNRQNEYTRNNLANPFNYLPMNNNTNSYVNKGVQMAKEGGEIDNTDDENDDMNWDFDIKEQEQPQQVDDSPYLAEQLAAQQDIQDEPIFIPEDAEENDNSESVSIDNVTPIPNSSATPIPTNNVTGFENKDEGFDLYMKHQQGPSGYPALKKAAETGKDWKEFYKGANLDNNMKSNIYSDFYKKYSELNPANFLDYWKGKYSSKMKEGANKQTILQPFIEKEAAKYGFTPDYVKGIINIESGFDANSNKNKSTQYKGLLQLNNEEFTKNGGTNIYDPFDNIRTGLKIIASKRK